MWKLPESGDDSLFAHLPPCRLAATLAAATEPQSAVNFLIQQLHSATDFRCCCRDLIIIVDVCTCFFTAPPCIRSADYNLQDMRVRGLWERAVGDN